MTERKTSTEHKENMTEKEVWFITGAGRGMGTDIANAALAAGHAVVATGRNPEKLAQAIGENEAVGREARRHRPRRGASGGAGRRRPLRPDRRALSLCRDHQRRIMSSMVVMTVCS
ncbi:SDR family NAD(P)-dependent oxidoreductase [Arthrobacter sp. 2RAF6]|uniref:SDR family NAD(P)-dependent oxidoreductase n=1 Tax=Arthrobacter sp. 2RAF6 TaxID=3233002 RepID=UPI003F923061